MEEVRVIAMPYELGRLRDGVGRGPERLLELGAEDALGLGGATVETEVLEFDGRFSSEVNTSFDLIGQVSTRVRAAIEAGAFPVVLSGSCFAAVGVVAGLAEAAPGVVWFDAHADFNTPDTTTFGYFDGMGLAILTGEAWRAMRAEVPGAGPIPDSSVVLAGARALDPAEQTRLAGSEIAFLPSEQVSPDAVAAAVEGLRPEPTGLYLHVDLDVLDPSEGQVNVYSAPGGVTAEALESAVGELIRRFDVRALSLTAYDPDCDPDGLIPPIALRLLRLVAARRRPQIATTKELP